MPSEMALKRTSEHRLGIVGLGRIGSSVALKMKNFGIPTGFYDPYVSRGIEKSFAITRYESVRELQKNSSIITFHAPLTNETNSMIDEDFIENLNRNTILVNNSRGGLIKNLDILIAALNSNKISFLGLDVIPNEPLDKSSNFYKIMQVHSNQLSSRIILTPHISYYSEQSWVEMRTKAALNVKNTLNGNPALNIVNTRIV
jgi:phosphoglycerate dehydrogenase-like enzyme